MQAVHDWRPVELLDPLTITQADSAGKVSSLTLSYAEDQVLPGAHNPFSETEARVGGPGRAILHLGNGLASRKWEDFSVVCGDTDIRWADGDNRRSKGFPYDLAEGWAWGAFNFFHFYAKIIRIGFGYTESPLDSAVWLTPPSPLEFLLSSFRS